MTEPLIKIKKGGDDFTMTDCEVNSGNRPAFGTEAKNTRLIRTPISSTNKTEPSKKSWVSFSMSNPLVYILVTILVVVVAKLIG